MSDENNVDVPKSQDELPTAELEGILGGRITGATLIVSKDVNDILGRIVNSHPESPAVRIPGNSALVVTNRLFAIELLKRHSITPLQEGLSEVIGEVPFTMNTRNPEWPVLREATDSLFRISAVKNLREPIEKVVSSAVDKAFNEAENGISFEVNIEKIAEDIAIKTIFETMFDVRFSEEQYKTLHRFIHKGEMFIGSKLMLPKPLQFLANTPVSRFVYPGGVNTYNEDKTDVRTWIGEVVKKYIADDGDNQMIGNLLEVAGGKQGYLDANEVGRSEIINQLTDQIIGLYAAGVATTTGYLQSVLALALSNVETLKLLSNEYNSLAHLGLSEALDKATTLDSFVNRATMVAPPVPFLLRVLESDVVVGGYEFKAGTTMYIPMAVFHNNVNLQTFVEGITQNTGAFGFGPKHCPGRPLALEEGRQLVWHILKILSKGVYNISYNDPIHFEAGFQPTHPVSPNLQVSRLALEQ